jgi:glucokinase
MSDTKGAVLAGRHDGWILGFDIGGTKTAVIVGTPDGTVLDRAVITMLPGASFDASWATITPIADRFVHMHGSPAAVGISVGGPVDTERGVVMSPPNLPRWDEVPLREICRSRYDAPTFLEHDGRAGALAEWLFGAGRGLSSLVFLTFGTGLGAGVIIDGRLVRGAHDAAGEVGRWRMARRGPRAYGKVGSWEGLASGSGLPRLARYRHPGRDWPDDMSAEVVVELARLGDAEALDAVDVAARWLGRGIAMLIDLLDPEAVILGSLAVRAGDLFLPTVIDVVQTETADRTRSCRIVPAGLGESIGDLAALSTAIHAGLDASR